MKRTLAALLLLLMIPALAGALQIKQDTERSGDSQLVVFSAQDDMPLAAPGKEAPMNPAKMAIDMQIAVRFAQDQARTAAKRPAGAHRRIHQRCALLQRGEHRHAHGAQRAVLCAF